MFVIGFSVRRSVACVLDLVSWYCEVRFVVAG